MTDEGKEHIHREARRRRFYSCGRDLLTVGLLMRRICMGSVVRRMGRKD